VRSHEQLPLETVLLYGEVPEQVEVREGGIRYLAAPWKGQKTGAFLDQRENRARAGQLARGHRAGVVVELEIDLRLCERGHLARRPRVHPRARRELEPAIGQQVQVPARLLRVEQQRQRRLRALA
jgi:hypothetical protein